MAQAQDEAQAEAPELDPPATAAPEPPPPDGVRVSGFVQVDGVGFHQASQDELDPGSGEPLNEDRFLIRRARVSVAARHGFVHGNITADANTVDGSTLRLLNAEASLGYPRGDTPYVEGRPWARELKVEGRPWARELSVELTLGLFLIPFGLETTELANRRLFFEPSTWVQALFPGRRDLGARLAGSWSFLHYAVALMNGQPKSMAFLPARDPNRAKDVVGNLRVEGELFPRTRLAVGASALWGRGFHAGAPPTKDMVVHRDANEDGLVQAAELQRLPGNPGTSSENFERFALGGDIALEVTWPLLGSGRLYAELTWASNLDRGLYVADPVSQGRDLRELGYMLALRQELTRHVEVGVRYDVYDPDRDATDRQGARVLSKDARFSTLSAVVAWCTLPYARLLVQYDHRENPLGRDRRGKPTTLAMDALTLRAQMEF